VPCDVRTKRKTLPIRIVPRGSINTGAKLLL
jgi:hypothetical protein